MPPRTTSPASSRSAKDYKSSVKPIWCPGCGHFGVQAALFRALEHLDLPPEQVAVISGIGHFGHRLFLALTGLY